MDGAGYPDHGLVGWALFDLPVDLLVDRWVWEFELSITSWMFRSCSVHGCQTYRSLFVGKTFRVTTLYLLTLHTVPPGGCHDGVFSEKSV